MDSVQAVSMWIGVVSGITGVVLAIVSIWFAFVVERNAAKVTLQLVQSLQKIESEVQRTTTDTSDLIKMAWERLLPGTSGGAGGSSELSASDSNGFESESESDIAQRISAGVAAELRTELANINGVEPEQVAQLNTALERLRRSVETQIEATAAAGRTDPVTSLREKLRSLSPAALALVEELAHVGGHLSRDQAVSLVSQEPMRRAMNEVRRKGIVVPLAGSEDEVVYWFPPNAYDLIPALLRVTDRPSRRVQAMVRAELREVGYGVDDSQAESGQADITSDDV